MFNIEELLKATKAEPISVKKDAPIKGVSIDSRTLKRGDLFIAIKGERFDGHDFIVEAAKKGASCVVAERNILQKVNIPLILVKDSIKALGDIAHFHRKRFTVPVIGITGSCGKTTAKEMLSFLLEEKFRVLKNEGTKNNQIGLPMTLLKLNPHHDIVVLEMGSNHFGEIKYLSKISAANIGVILNIGPAHLEFFGNLSAVFREKYELIRNLNEPAIGILNADDKFLSTILKKNEDKTLFGFGLKSKCDFLARDLRTDKDGLVFELNRYRIRLNSPGLFNAYNALASVACVRLFGLSYPAAISRLEKFKSPPGRLNLRKINNAVFIDDTYNSNPLSLKESFNALKNIGTKGRKIAVIGDMLELGRKAKGFHLQAGKTLSQICDIIIIAGKFSRYIALGAKKSRFNKEGLYLCGSSREAKDILFNVIKPSTDDVVLVKGSRAMKMEEVFAR